MKKNNQSLQFAKNIKKEQWVLFFVHLSFWLMLSVVLSLFSNSQHGLPVFMVFFYFYGFIIFYLNYFFLTPRFLLPKKYLIFSISILIIVLASIFLVDPVIHELSINDFVRSAPSEFNGQPFLDNYRAKGAEGNKFFLPMFLPAMFFLLFTSLTFSSLVRVFQKLKREEAINQYYKHEKRNTELTILRHQVNPHFLFNSLNNIHSLANRKSDLTSEAIMRLSSMLRYMLSESLGSEIPVSREIAMIENYIDLQKLWLKNAIKVDFVVENVTENYYIEPFILKSIGRKCL